MPSPPLFDPDRCRAVLGRLDFSRPDPGPAFSPYLRHYGLIFPKARHYIGTFAAGGYQIAAQVMVPQTARGTAFLLHGYYDHVGILSPLIRFLLEKRLCVAAFDLPGHGLSTGERATINDFAEYQTVLAAFIQIAAHPLPPPWYLIGHSTGGAIALDYLAGKPQPVFKKAVLLAPLVRSAWWNLSRTAHQLLGWAVSDLPRAFPDNSHNPRFNRFIRKHDPLQARSVPAAWVNALFAWESDIQDCPPVWIPVGVIQGTDDKVVDWQYNLRFLRRKLKQASVYTLPGARHHLINEAPRFQARVFEWIERVLS